jgi:DNA invertase Pin-like site-specific DNA recombinase
MTKRCALYARVSTTDQTCENQLLELRRFAAARGWESLEYVDSGVSGAKERRLQLDAMKAAVRSRKVDAVVATKLDRLARSVHHLVAMGQEFQALGVDLVVLDQAIDSTTASGRLLFHVLASIAEFERDLIRDRVMAGLRRAKSQGVRLGRKPRLIDVPRARLAIAQGQSMRQIAKALGVGASTLSSRLRGCAENTTHVSA